MIEVEVKVKADHSKIRPILEKIGASKIGVEEQSDVYFAAPYRNFAKTDEALRIRSLGGQAVLTYKGPKLDKVSKTRVELETPVDGATTAKIFHSLGFQEAGTVHKKRDIFRAGEITVCLDAVEGLGEFLEVELDVEDEKDLKSSRDQLFKFLSQFGLSETDSIRTSYLEMVLEKRN
ncbi:Adenylate cyclase [Methanosarcina horonobensis HB-1 = JCM 15518]|uniref:Adenylate cyclase n=1 Tax=Methanosarcina horonobensis HB-1 = JCM 15518 TaxID=1434110 RepID=A0A0E3SCH5_9EURY|nr:class IV adenylate cyclase [Methanosarcina horonobensis]AKB77008.1 Adenylate cyclase [Methanosarcina horonobensis HB-1 = JCM 15518]